VFAQVTPDKDHVKEYLENPPAGMCLWNLNFYRMHPVVYLFGRLGSVNTTKIKQNRHSKRPRSGVSVMQKHIHWIECPVIHITCKCNISWFKILYVIIDNIVSISSYAL
jgi:hypothetical protein